MRLCLTLRLWLLFKHTILYFYLGVPVPSTSEQKIDMEKKRGLMAFTVVSVSDDVADLLTVSERFLAVFKTYSHYLWCNSKALVPLVNLAGLRVIFSSNMLMRKYSLDAVTLYHLSLR